MSRMFSQDNLIHTSICLRRLYQWMWSFYKCDSSKLEMPLVNIGKQIPHHATSSGQQRLTWESWDLAPNFEQCSNMFQHVPRINLIHLILDLIWPSPNILWLSGAFKRSNKSVTLVTGFLCTRIAKIGSSRVCNASHFSTGGLDSHSVATCLPLDAGSGYKR